MNDATDRLLRARVCPTRRPAMRQRWDGFDVGDRTPDFAHCCQGVAIEAFSLVPAHA